ncbi:MAG: YggS family pyridoxal phosphate-dependent enzyme [Planctomycetota bacterium]|nr:MAG: YggS family pyridoxal phosphate-dependent enzyme [Planctomycetota bacterium]
MPSVSLVHPLPRTPLAERLAPRLADVERRVAAACARAGRERAAVRVLPVTKSVEPAVAAALLELGHAELAENRADELERKRAWFAERGLAVRWHFIGHLQRNKARRVARACAEIHSVDSAELYDTLARVCDEEGLELCVWLQAKLWPEDNKGGFTPEELLALWRAAPPSPRLRWRGLMAMAPLLDDDAAAARAARTVFSGLRELARRGDPARFDGGRVRLSIGMSSDFEIAIEEGADVVRIGSALFEESGAA